MRVIPSSHAPVTIALAVKETFKVLMREPPRATHALLPLQDTLLEFFEFHKK